MRALVPEIAWHNKNPVFTVDVQREINKGFYRAATGGGDSHVVIWHLMLKEEENETVVSVNFAADLDRHIKAVNVVRFSNCSKLLASGDDDAVIILWSLKEQNNCGNTFTNEEGNKENWVSVKVLRGHKDDIYDLSWSPFSSEIISGSVDNTAMLWDVNKGQHLGKFGEHNGFVQGVAWDPKGKYLATLCSDRALRLFDAETKKMTAKITKAKVNKSPVQEELDDENLMRLFHDDTVKTFFRRLCFSPDGNLIFAPCGIYQDADCEAKPLKDVTYIFLKSKPERPVFHLPSRDEYTVAVRCCPVLFELNPTVSNLFTLPYRIVFAIASRSSIIFYDTQQLQPLGIVGDIHYATLTDISWSSDGRFLLASSSDGYCTIVTFNKDELGIPCSKAPSVPDPGVLDVILEDLGVEPLDQSVCSTLNESISELVEDKKPEDATIRQEISTPNELIIDLAEDKRPDTTTRQEISTPNESISDLAEGKIPDTTTRQEISTPNESISDLTEDKKSEDTAIRQEISTANELIIDLAEDKRQDTTTRQEISTPNESISDLTEDKKPEDTTISAMETSPLDDANETSNLNASKGVINDNELMEVDIACNEAEREEQKNLTM